MRGVHGLFCVGFFSTDFSLEGKGVDLDEEMGVVSMKCFSCGCFCAIFSLFAWVFIDVLKGYWRKKREGNMVREILA